MKLSWDAPGQRLFEAGVDQGVLYVDDEIGVPWNGLVSVDENPDGGESHSYFLDGVKYLDTISYVDYKATLEAYTYPDEFEACIGMLDVVPGLLATSQPQKYFGLSYRTRVGNDIEGADHAFKIHVVYNAVATPSKQTYKTLGGSVDPMSFSWDITAVPVRAPGRKPSAHFIFDSRTLPEDSMSVLLDLLYGGDGIDAHLPLLADLVDLIQTGPYITIVDNGDGSWRAIGPNELIHVNSDGSFVINDANAIFLDEETYRLRSSQDGSDPSLDSDYGFGVYGANNYGN